MWSIFSSNIKQKIFLKRFFERKKRECMKMITVYYLLITNAWDQGRWAGRIWASSREWLGQVWFETACPPPGNTASGTARVPWSPRCRRESWRTPSGSCPCPTCTGRPVKSCQKTINTLEACSLLTILYSFLSTLSLSYENLAMRASKWRFLRSETDRVSP